MNTCTLLTLCTVFFFAAVSDIRFRIIPNRLFLTGVLLAALIRLLQPLDLNAFDLLAGSGILFGSAAFHFRHQIGGGDVKMILFLQLLYPGYQGLMVLWFGLLYSGLAGIIGWLRFGNRSMRLGPGMFLGALTAAVGGFI